MDPLYNAVFKFAADAAKANYISGITGNKEEKEINDDLEVISNIAINLVKSSDKAAFAREIRQELTKLKEAKGVSDEDRLKLTNVFLHVLGQEEQATTIEKGMEVLNNIENPKTDQKPAASTTPKRPVGGVPVPGFGSPVKQSPRAVVSPKAAAAQGTPSPKPSPIQKQPIVEEVPPRPFPRKPISDTPPPLPPRDDETPAGGQPAESADLPPLDMPLPSAPGSQNPMPVGRSPIKQRSNLNQGSGSKPRPGVKPAPTQQPTAGEQTAQREQPVSGKTSGKIGADRLAFLQTPAFQPKRKKDPALEKVNVKAITANLEKFFAGFKKENEVFKQQIKEETRAYIEAISDELKGSVENTVSDVNKIVDDTIEQATDDIQKWIQDATTGVDENVSQQIYEDLEKGILPGGMTLRKAFSLAFVARTYQKCLEMDVEKWRKLHLGTLSKSEHIKINDIETALNFYEYFHRNLGEIEQIECYKGIGKTIRTLEAMITGRGDPVLEKNKIIYHQKYIEEGDIIKALDSDRFIGDTDEVYRLDPPKEIPKWLADGLASS